MVYELFSEDGIPRMTTTFCERKIDENIEAEVCLKIRKYKLRQRIFAMTD